MRDIAPDFSPRESPPYVRRTFISRLSAAHAATVRLVPFQPRRFPSTRGSHQGAPILSVGRRVFVNGPDAAPSSVALLDEIGNTAGLALPAGAAVEILAWRPRGAGGPRYRVRSTDDGREGWLPGARLRASSTRLGSSPVPPADR